MGVQAFRETEMTRPIKFRAWDKRDKRMMFRTVFDRNWYGTPANDENGCNTLRGISPDDQPRIELMQFTGLRDKNGVEIYEGDVVAVEVTDTFQSICLVHWHNGKGGMHDAGWKFKRLDTPKFESVCCEDDLTVWYATVIGNIYQHPELLEAK